jgi:AraC-like DNA-binding protein
MLAAAEAALRGGALTAVALSLWILWPRARTPSGRLGIAALAAGLSAYVVVSSSLPLPPSVTVALSFLSALNPPLLWAGGLRLLDEAKGRQSLMAPLVGIFAAVAALRLALPGLSGILGLAHGAGMALLYADVLARAWLGREGDLVEARRGLRRGVAAAGAALGLAIAAVETGLVPTGPPPLTAMLQAGALWAVTLGTTALLTTLPPSILPPARTGDAVLTDAERAVLDRLQAAMAAGVWREEGLTVGALASRIGTTEHRLRRIINRGLGAGNFAQFINGRRIAAACTALSDPALADRPVQQIGYEVGFGSPGPFNRAFREATGQSPTAFRAAALERAKVQ